MQVLVLHAMSSRFTPAIAAGRNKCVHVRVEISNVERFVGLCWIVHGIGVNRFVTHQASVGHVPIMVCENAHVANKLVLYHAMSLLLSVE